MISTSQKEHLMYTAIGQIAFIVIGALIMYSYIIPGFGKIGTRVSAANQAVQDYKEIDANGLSFERLGLVLKEIKGREELISIITKAPNDAKAVIKKVGDLKYLDWLKQALASSDEDRRKLVQIKQKINSILPTLSPMSNGVDEDNITLKQYVKYMENKVLKEFDFDSNMVLGLQGIVYGSNGVPKTIGTFDVSMDFDGTNGDIQRFITYVNESGDGSSLNDGTGSITNTSSDTPSVMSNPLITMEGLSLKEPLDLSKPNAKNSGRTTIRFYIRGSSQDDVTYLTEGVKNRKDALKKRISDAVSECRKNEAICSNLENLEDFEKKYDEFLLGIGASKQTTDTIASLSQQVTSLRGLEKEFEVLSPTTSATN